MIQKMFYLLVFTLIFNSCSSLFYHPDHFEYVNRAKIPWKPQDIYFKSESGAKLHAWLFQGKKTKKEDPPAIILQFHGNAQNLSSHFYNLYFTLDNGFDYFIFDYPGYGQSEGNPTPDTTVSSGESAILWVQSHYPNTPLIIVGQSLGGAIMLKSMIELKKKNNLPKVLFAMCDSSFSSYRYVAKTLFSKHWLTWIFQPVAWTFADNSESPENDLMILAGIPFLITHNKTDKIVDFKNGERLFEKLPHPKSFLILKNGNHTDFFLRENGAYQKKWMEFIHSMIKNPVSHDLSLKEKIKPLFQIGPIEQIL